MSLEFTAPSVRPTTDAPTSPLFNAAYNKPHDSGLSNVFSQLGSGVKDEIVNHPWRVAENVAFGLGSSAIAAVSPQRLLAGIAVVGGVLVASELAHALPGIVRDAGIAYDPSKHTDKEIDAAEKHLQSVGRTSLDIAAGFAAMPYGRAVVPPLSRLGAAIDTKLTSTGDAIARTFRTVSGAAGDTASTLGRKVSEVFSSGTSNLSIKETAGNLKNIATIGLSNAKESTISFAGKVAEKTKDIAGPTFEKISSTAGNVAGRASELAAKTRDFIYNNYWKNKTAYTTESGTVKEATMSSPVKTQSGKMGSEIPTVIEGEAKTTTVEVPPVFRADVKTPEQPRKTTKPFAMRADDPRVKPHEGPDEIV